MNSNRDAPPLPAPEIVCYLFIYLPSPLNLPSQPYPPHFWFFYFFWWCYHTRHCLFSGCSLLYNAALGLLRTRRGGGQGGNNFHFLFIKQFFYSFFFVLGALIGLLSVGIMRGDGRCVCMICMYVCTRQVRVRLTQVSKVHLPYRFPKQNKKLLCLSYTRGGGGSKPPIVRLYVGLTGRWCFFCTKSRLFPGVFTSMPYHRYSYHSMNWRYI